MNLLGSKSLDFVYIPLEPQFSPIMVSVIFRGFTFQPSYVATHRWSPLLTYPTFAARLTNPLMIVRKITVFDIQAQGKDIRVHQRYALVTYLSLFISCLYENRDDNCNVYPRLKIDRFYLK